MPLEGWSVSSRQLGDGIKQAALLALVRTHLENGELAKARSAADDFSLLYPLDGSSAAAREIRGLLDDCLLKEGAAALRAGRLQAAVDAYDHWLHARAAGVSPASGTLDLPTAKVRLQLLGALP
ncbi:MAG: hypothetical protein NTW87_22040 [Planctomycetota bacterium]|nr:hypothetical protein [Planctomycetota bacterium]